jgi:hypothetical protein
MTPPFLNMPPIFFSNICTFPNHFHFFFIFLNLKKKITVAFSFLEYFLVIFYYFIF